MRTKIEVSARHIHLTSEDFRKLFGKSDATVRNMLESEKGEFAACETVEIVGPEGRIHNVRVLGPFRSKSQLEIAKSDAILIDIDAPITISGNNEGALVRIIGPKGEISKNIAMIAKRHLHLSPVLSEKWKIRDKSQVKVKINGVRGLILENVVVRVDPRFHNHVHLDTDEGNAAGIDRTSWGEIMLK